MIRLVSTVKQGAAVVPGKFQIMHSCLATRLRAYCRARGFTLVELMVTLAVGAILAMIAVPSFQHLIISNRLTTSANALVDAVNTARMDAIKLNAMTQFCSNTSAANTTADNLGIACGTDTGAIYALPQSATTAAEVRASPLDLNSQIKISGTVIAIRFGGQGFGYNANGGTSSTPYGGDVATVCTSQLSSDNQRIVSMTAGSILAVASSTGSCP